ncbi:hypothetical protein FRC11_008915, partial [Ceratobasidium sp. 423]
TFPVYRIRRFLHIQAGNQDMVHPEEVEAATPKTLYTENTSAKVQVWSSSNSPQPGDWSAAKGPPDPYGIVAHEITRTVNMFWEPRQVITAWAYLVSLDTQDEIDNEIEFAEGQYKQLYNLFDILNHKLPDFAEKLTEGEEEWKRVRKRLEDRKRWAKTEDNFQIKDHCPTWRKWDPPSHRLKKTSCGLGHMCGFASTRNCEARGRSSFIFSEFHRFRVEQDPPATADIWPSLCYNGDEIDPNNLENGLFYSELMIKTGRNMLFPPTVANAERPSDSKPNREPKADVYEMDAVTPGFIAYVAILLWYALSDESSFMKSSGMFNYVIFFNEVVAYIELPEFTDKTKDLIEWWNERIFPRKAPTRDHPTGMLARFREQHAAAAAEGNRAPSEANND